MDKRGIFGWLTLDMVVFLAINIFLIAHFHDDLAHLHTINFFGLLILGLAAYRAANIISNEVVTKPLRAPFVDEKMKDGKTVEEPKKKGFLAAMGLLIYCPSCSGVWIATLLVYSYIFWPEQTFVVAVLLALSAIERILAAIVGWFKQSK